MRRLVAAAPDRRSPFSRERAFHAPRARPHPVRRLPQRPRGRPHHRLPAAAAHAVLPRHGGIPHRRRRRARSATSSTSRPTCRCGRCRARPTRSQELWDGDGVRWPLEDAAIVTVPHPGRTARRRARGVDRAAAAHVVHPESSTSPRPTSVTKHVTLSPEATGAPFQYGVSPLQLHGRLRHGARPRDRDGGHRRHRRDRHRDPRRGPRPELPEPVAGVGRRLVPPAREVRPRAHELRLVDRHPPALQRPERPRHDRRGGRRGAPARPAAREAARVPVRPARRSASSRATWSRTRSGPRSSSASCRWPKSST